MRDGTLSHPKDWRNIPQCVVQTTGVILERIQFQEKRFNASKETNDSRAQKLQGQIVKVKNDQEEQYKLLSDAQIEFRDEQMELAVKIQNEVKRIIQQEDKRYSEA